MSNREVITGLVIGLVMLLAFNVAVSMALEVEPLPAQPELKVEQGRSTIYEDGSIDLQPASKQGGAYLQQTIHASELQGN